MGLLEEDKRDSIGASVFSLFFSPVDRGSLIVWREAAFCTRGFQNVLCRDSGTSG